MNINNIHSQRPQYKYLSLISMVYLAIMLTGNIVTYRLVDVAGLLILAGSFLTPTWFVIGDIVTEVYGYAAYRKMIWHTLICSIVFTLLCLFFISLPHPGEWLHQEKYEYILLKLPRVVIASIVGILAGAFLNSFFISKWKILVRGKHFWLRSIGSSFIGELAFTVATMTLTMLGHVRFIQLLKLIAFSFLLKIIITSALLPFSILITFFLKKQENLDVYDYKENFNPFRIGND